MIRILVVDDHTLFRRGLTALLARAPGLEVAADAGDAGEALRKAQALQPDLVLLDNHLPGVTGIDAIPSLRQAAPAAKVVLLTVSEDEQDLAAALRAGASGYLLKTMEAEELVTSIRRVMGGASVIAADMTTKLVAAYQGAASAADAAAGVVVSARPMDPIDSLSPRERDILIGIAHGDSNKQIARTLGIAETTVKVHVQSVLRKLNLSSRVQAAVTAKEHGLV